MHVNFKLRNNMDDIKKDLPKPHGTRFGKRNKSNSIRTYLQTHSEKYFKPNKDNEDEISDFEKDLQQLSPAERVNAEIKILKHHTAELKSVDMDVAVGGESEEICSILERLAEENQI